MGSLITRMAEVFKDQGLLAIFEQTIPEDAKAALLWWTRNQGRERNYDLSLNVCVDSLAGLSRIKYSIKREHQFPGDPKYTMSATANLTPWRQIKMIERKYTYQQGATILTKAELMVKTPAQQRISLLPPKQQPNENMKVILESETPPPSVRMFMDVIAKHCVR
jgi:hypothetical protein